MDLGDVARVLARASPGHFLLAILVSFGDRFLMIGKWYPLLVVQAPQVGFGAATRSYFAATFANYLLPSTVGPDALRAAALGRPHGRAMEVGASILVERLTGMLANGVLVLVAALVALKTAVPIGAAVAIAVGLLAATLVVVLAPLSPRLRSRARSILPEKLLAKHHALAERFVRAYLAYRRVPGVLVVVGLLTLVEVCAPILIGWILCISLDLRIPFDALFVSIAIAQLVAKIPISFAGLGTLEGSLVTMLAAFGFAPESALALAALLRATDIAVSIPGAFLMRDLARGLRALPVANP